MERRIGIIQGKRTFDQTPESKKKKKKKKKKNGELQSLHMRGRKGF
jgi:hypothetical protein